MVERLAELHRRELADLVARPRAERDPHLRDARFVEPGLAQLDLYEDLALAGVHAFGLAGAVSVDLQLEAVRAELAVDLAARLRVRDPARNARTPQLAACRPATAVADAYVAHGLAWQADVV